MPKEIIKPFEHFDEVDLAVNGEIFECPLCGGTGEIRGTTPDGEEFEDACDQCNGQGSLGVLRYNPKPIKKN